MENSYLATIFNRKKGVRTNLFLMNECPQVSDIFKVPDTYTTLPFSKLLFYKKLIINFLCLISILFFNTKTIAQSLYQDVQALTESLAILDQKTDTTSQAEIVEATATVFAILENYHQPLTKKNTVRDEEKLLRAYRNNPSFQTTIDPAVLQFPDSLRGLIEQRVATKQRQLRSGARQQMLQILKSNAAVSPVDYLAIPQTVQKYALPPVSKKQQLTQVTDGVNRNVSNGFLTSQAAVIEGLFRFILNRAKDEVLINYLDRLLNEDTPRFKKLFPTVVTEFGKQEFTYSESFLRRLRHAFYEDVQKISVRLPYLMLTDEYFQQLQSQPIAYNFLVIYSMMGLAQRDYEVDEIVPLTHRYLYDSYEEAVKKVNTELVEKAADSEAYFRLITESEVMLQQLKEIFGEFADAEFAIDDLIAEMEDEFGVDDAPLVTDYLDEESNNLKTVLGQGAETPFTLNMLPQLIAGEWDENYLKQYNTLADFDRFFNKNYTSAELRAAGLEVVEKLQGTWYNDQSLSDLLYDWQERLQHYRDDVDAWRMRIDTASTFAEEVAAVKQERINLQNVILQTKQFWWDSLQNQQRVAFAVLAEVINEAAFQTIEDQNSVREMLGEVIATEANLRDQRNLLAATETRLTRLDNELYETYKSIETDSPARKYLVFKKGERSYNYLRPKIAQFDAQLVRLNHLKDSLERTFTPLYRRERDNAKPVLQMTEAATYLMYNLRSNEQSNDNKWLKIKQLDTVLTDTKQRPIFLGLLQQQLNSIQDLGTFNPNALAQLTDLTLREIPTLQEQLSTDSLQLRDSMLFYRKAAFTINTLNRILQLPLIAKRENSNEIQPFLERYPQMQRVPAISEQALDVVYYLNIKDHGKAVSSLIRLFTDLDELEQKTVSQHESKTAHQQSRHESKIARQQGSQRKKGKKYRKQADKNVVRYLRKYGDFIAGLIDARTTGEVEYLLETIADPPGSSRIKRYRNFTVGINSYVAATFGQEFFNDQDRNVQTDQFNFAPNMPIGISISGLFGRPVGFDGKVRKRASLSTFISFLDLGSLFTYSAPINNFGQSEFTFKNVFKLGAQVHWNINRSPFFLGAGVQYGPQFREIGSKQQAVESIRYFLGFGVDVPIKTLYQR